MFESMLFFD